MDEFQRFRDLLHGDSDAAILARELFDYSGGDGHAARTLLLVRHALSDADALRR